MLHTCRDSTVLWNVKDACIWPGTFGVSSNKLMSVKCGEVCCLQQPYNISKHMHCTCTLRTCFVLLEYNLQVFRRQHFSPLVQPSSLFEHTLTTALLLSFVLELPKWSCKGSRSTLLCSWNPVGEQHDNNNSRHHNIWRAKDKDFQGQLRRSYHNNLEVSWLNLEHGIHSID